MGHNLYRLGEAQEGLNDSDQPINWIPKVRKQSRGNERMAKQTKGQFW